MVGHDSVSVVKIYSVLWNNLVFRVLNANEYHLPEKVVH
jgi:hypothetical protein